MTEHRWIRITATPPGEAPEPIRSAWVGLYLPLASGKQPRTLKTVGVLTGPKSLFASWFAVLSGRADDTEGYLVSSRTAIERLDAVAPEAAAWWREHAAHFMQRHRLFVFDVHACDPVSEELVSRLQLR